MRLHFWRTAICLAVLCAVATTRSGELILHYTFEHDNDATIVDEQGNSPGFATAVTYGPGRVGDRCARFDGTNSFIRVPTAGTALNLAGTPYTIAFWMKGFARNASPQGIVFQEILWMGPEVLKEPSPPRYLPADGYGFNSGLGAAAWRQGNGADSDLLVYASPGKIGNTNWIHFAVVFDGSERRMYMNGSLSNSITVTNALLPLNGYDLYIGSADTNILDYPWAFYHGSLDDLRIYNSALPDSEIAALASAPVSIKLEFQQGPDSFDLRWPIIDPLHHYTPQSSVDLVSEEWNPVQGFIQRDGEYLRVSLPLTNSFSFFRLQQQ